MANTDVSISPGAGLPQPPAPIVEVRGLSKSFPGVRALKEVSLAVAPGEVHGLVGENGAGKSTLLKVVAGVYAPDAGELFWEGLPLHLGSPSDAVARGIDVIPQEISLSPELSAAENMMVGHYPSRLGRVRWRQVSADARAIAEKLNLRADLSRAAAELSVAEQRLVMIGRALTRRARLLIMDEPTVALSETEVEVLADVVRELRNDGVTIVYVSHRLDEVLELTDRVTVMKDGEVVGTRPTGEVDRDTLVGMIIGRELEALFPDRDEGAGGGEPLLRVHGLSGARVRDLSFDLHRGEVLGFAGLVGSGRTRVLRMLFGADPHDAGTVELDGERVEIRSPRDAIRAGIALLPEDRRGQGAVVDMSVTENVTLPVLRRYAAGGVVIRHRQEAAAAREKVRELRVATPSVRQRLADLSGGNQQKALVAKWLMSGARVFLFDEPASGVDVGAKQEIFTLISGLAAAGAGVIVISSEVEEIVGLCHRTLVMREGRVAGELGADETTEAAILQLCFEAHANGGRDGD